MANSKVVEKLSFYKSGIIQFTQNQLSGMTKTMAGIISAIGNSFTLIIRNPVANIKNPPHALKSAIMSGVVNGIMNFAPKNKQVKMINCGTAMIDTT